jgi:hypothetical protein
VVAGAVGYAEAAVADEAAAEFPTISRRRSSWRAAGSAQQRCG